MKYYIIKKDDTFIGVVSSNNFIRYQEANSIFVNSNEINGELVEYNNKLYRDVWMSPMNNKANVIYEVVSIIETTEEHYISFIKAIQKNEIIDIEDWIPAPVPTPVIPTDIGSLDFLRSSKISEMSYECRKAIEAGTDVIIRGQIRHFSMTQQDQLNFISLGTLAQTQDLIPYHADGESCVFYTANEINQIISATTAHKIYQTTYYNALKEYINSLETIEEIAAITYGTPIPDEYQSEVLRVIKNEN